MAGIETTVGAPVDPQAGLTGEEEMELGLGTPAITRRAQNPRTPSAAEAAASLSSVLRGGRAIRGKKQTAAADVRRGRDSKFKNFMSGLGEGIARYSEAGSQIVDKMTGIPNTVGGTVAQAGANLRKGGTIGVGEALGGVAADIAVTGTPSKTLTKEGAAIAEKAGMAVEPRFKPAVTSEQIKEDFSEENMKGSDVMADLNRGVMMDAEEAAKEDASREALVSIEDIDNAAAQAYDSARQKAFNDLSLGDRMTLIRASNTRDTGTIRKAAAIEAKLDAAGQRSFREVFDKGQLQRQGQIQKEIAGREAAQRNFALGLRNAGKGNTTLESRGLTRQGLTPQQAQVLSLVDRITEAAGAAPEDSALKEEILNTLLPIFGQMTGGLTQATPTETGGIPPKEQGGV